MAYRRLSSSILNIFTLHLSRRATSGIVVYGKVVAVSSLMTWESRSCNGAAAWPTHSRTKGWFCEKHKT
jgi:hypothetical protein